MNPWSRKIPHAMEQLSLTDTTTEPVRLEPVPCNKRRPRLSAARRESESWYPWLGEAAPQPECCSVCAQKAPAEIQVRHAARLDVTKTPKRKLLVFLPQKEVCFNKI